jgi:hypothetical protein
MEQGKHGHACCEIVFNISLSFVSYYPFLDLVLSLVECDLIGPNYLLNLIIIPYELGNKAEQGAGVEPLPRIEAWHLQLFKSNAF